MFFSAKLGYYLTTCKHFTNYFYEKR